VMARAGRFKDRGTLGEGMAAAIVIYDINAVQSLPSEIAYDLPANEWRRVQKADGYKHILVNGVETFQDGNCTGATPGKLLRNGAAREAGKPRERGKIPPPLFLVIAYRG